MRYYKQEDRQRVERTLTDENGYVISREDYLTSSKRGDLRKLAETIAEFEYYDWKKHLKRRRCTLRDCLRRLFGKGQQDGVNR